MKKITTGVQVEEPVKTKPKTYTFDEILKVVQEMQTKYEKLEQERISRQTPQSHGCIL